MTSDATKEAAWVAIQALGLILIYKIFWLFYDLYKTRKQSLLASESEKHE